MGDQGSLSARLARQLRTPAVNPTFVVLAKAREGVAHAQPHRAIDGAEPGEGAADVRGWRREDPWWQGDWPCRRNSAVQRRRRWGAARDPRCGHALTEGGISMMAIDLVGRRPPTSAASPRARLCRSGGRCITKTDGRTRKSYRAQNHPWVCEDAGTPRSWLALLLRWNVWGINADSQMWLSATSPNTQTLRGKEFRKTHGEDTKKKQLEELKNDLICMRARPQCETSAIW